MDLGALFTTFIYQPFFNLLVFFYWILDQVTGGNPDMGIAVVFLTIAIRFLLLPMTLSGERSEKDRREIAAKIKEIEVTFSHDPVAIKEESKKVMRKGQKVVVGELVSLAIQVVVALMLYRIFATGLEGEDFHLLYSFMPKIDEPVNLVFLGRFDLSHTSWVLNFVQSICIFVLETLAVLTSPYPHSRNEVVRLQLVLPIVAFVLFMFLPAGKKVFVITTLLFSIVLTLIRYVRRRFLEYKEQKELEEQAPPAEAIVVETK